MGELYKRTCKRRAAIKDLGYDGAASPYFLLCLILFNSIYKSVDAYQALRHAWKPYLLVLPWGSWGPWQERFLGLLQAPL